MRMLHVIESLAPGGMETTFLNVLRHFKEADGSIRHDVLAFAGGALEDGYRQAADHVTIGSDAETIEHRLAAGYDLAYILFERCAYRVLPQLVARTPTPVVYGKDYDMGGKYRLNEGLRWQADESMLAACDGVTFTTAKLAGGYDLPVGRTTILGKAADVARFQAIPAPPPPSTPQRIVCIANLHPRKRLGDLIHALVRVRRHVPHAELRLVGGGHEADTAPLLQLASSLGVEDAVTLTGMVLDVAQELEDARIVALPSSCEGVPTALLEGMAAGRPIVATAVGHVSSIVDQGREGILVPAGDVETLGDALTELLVNPALAARMGQAARARSAEHDVRVVARRLLRALRACTAHAA